MPQQRTGFAAVSSTLGLKPPQHQRLAASSKLIVECYSDPMNISNQSWWYLILKAKPTIRGRMTFKMKIWSFLFLRSLSVTGRQGSLLTTRRPTIIVRCSALCIALLPRAIDCFDALPSFILQHNSMPVGKGKVNSRMCQVCLKSLFRPSLFVKRLPRLTSFREQCWWWWWRWWQWW